MAQLVRSALGSVAEQLRKGCERIGLLPHEAGPSSPRRPNARKRDRHQPQSPQGPPPLQPPVSVEVSSRLQLELLETNVQLDVTPVVVLEVAPQDVGVSTAERDAQPIVTPPARPVAKRPKAAAGPLDDLSDATFALRHRRYEAVEKRIRNREQEVYLHSQYRQQLELEHLEHAVLNRRPLSASNSVLSLVSAEGSTARATPAPAGRSVGAHSDPSFAALAANEAQYFASDPTTQARACTLQLAPELAREAKPRHQLDCPAGPAHLDALERQAVVAFATSAGLVALRGGHFGQGPPKRRRGRPPKPKPYQPLGAWMTPVRSLRASRQADFLDSDGLRGILADRAASAFCASHSDSVSIA